MSLKLLSSYLPKLNEHMMKSCHDTIFTLAFMGQIKTGKAIDHLPQAKSLYIEELGNALFRHSVRKYNATDENALEVNELVNHEAVQTSAKIVSAYICKIIRPDAIRCSWANSYTVGELKNALSDYDANQKKINDRFTEEMAKEVADFLRFLD